MNDYTNSNDTIELTNADMEAIKRGDADYINNKGAKYYTEQKYDLAAAYYHIASSMGSVCATSNLGYCYLYGRHTDANLSLAIAYFKMSADKGNVDSAYKLGDIYSKDKWVEKDTELSLYYYNMASELILQNHFGTKCVLYCETFDRFPSLCFALGRETSKYGSMSPDVYLSYQYLLHAKKGYELELGSGNKMYEESYNNLLKLMKDSQYDNVRNELENEFNDVDDYDSDYYDEDDE